MACTDPRRETVGLMHNLCRDDNGRSFTASVFVSSLLASDVGSEGGNEGRRSSVMNCES